MLIGRRCRLCLRASARIAVAAAVAAVDFCNDASTGYLKTEPNRERRGNRERRRARRSARPSQVGGDRAASEQASGRYLRERGGGLTSRRCRFAAQKLATTRVERAR